MKKVIGFVIVIVLVFLGRQGYVKIIKLRHAQRLKIAVENFTIPKINISSLFTNVPINLTLSLKNFSKSAFNLEQINVEVFSLSGELIAEQTNPLQESKKLLPNQSNLLPLSFLISPQNFKNLIRETGGITSVGANFLTSGKYGIPLRLKGFVVAEGFKVDINETITV